MNKKSIIKELGHCMNESVKEYLNGFPQNVETLFLTVRVLIFKSEPDIIEEKLWAKMPTYCANDAFVRLIPFKDHLNIEAAALAQQRDALKEYKFTPKGMLQLYPANPIPIDILEQVFKQTLHLGF